MKMPISFLVPYLTGYIVDTVITQDITYKQSEQKA